MIYLYFVFVRVLYFVPAFVAVLRRFVASFDLHYGFVFI